MRQALRELPPERVKQLLLQHVRRCTNSSQCVTCGRLRVRIQAMRDRQAQEVAAQGEREGEGVNANQVQRGPFGAVRRSPRVKELRDRAVAQGRHFPYYPY